MYRSAEKPIGPAAKPPREPAELPTEHLEHELCVLASDLTAAMARWISLVDEFDRREGWAKWRGVNSTAHWISWRCSCSERRAREHVQVASALRELPQIREAFAAGSLSYSKVRALTRVATPESQEFLIHQATYATASQLERMLSAYSESERPDPECHGEPSLRWSWARDGSLHLEARLSPDDGRAFLDALEAARSHIREKSHAGGDESGSAEPLLGDVATNADALSLLAESFLATGPSERAGPQRRQLVVGVDAETLASDEPGRSDLGDGPHIDPETARRLGCDATLRALVKRGKRTLFLGRKTRTISRRRQLGAHIPRPARRVPRKLAPAAAGLLGVPDRAKPCRRSGDRRRDPAQGHRRADGPTGVCLCGREGDQGAAAGGDASYS